VAKNAQRRRVLQEIDLSEETPARGAGGDFAKPTYHGQPASRGQVNHSHGSPVRIGMKASAKSVPQPTLAARVSGEDLACGDYVGVLSQIVEFPSFFWDSCTSANPGELVRMQVIPHDAGTPLKVLAICLPFIYVKSPQGVLQTLDTRKSQLARLDRRCAKLICRRLQTPAA
jgi:hypothetical protein